MLTVVLLSLPVREPRAQRIQVNFPHDLKSLSRTANGLRLEGQVCCTPTPPFCLPVATRVSLSELSSHLPLRAYSHIHFELQAQRDGDIEAMTIRALHKAKFQQLGISDMDAVQGAT